MFTHGKGKRNAEALIAAPKAEPGAGLRMES